MKSKRNRVLRWGCLIFILLTFLYYQMYFEIEDRIKEGKIQYTKEVGWINWGHAMPEATQLAYEHFKKQMEEGHFPFTFSYPQKMKYSLFGFILILQCEGKITIDHKLDEQEQRKVFIQLFKVVSEYFESKQGEAPYSFTTQSSFREGDLMGNLISLHTTLNKDDMRDVKKNLSALEPNKALVLWSEKKCKKKRWKELSFMKDTELTLSLKQLKKEGENGLSPSIKLTHDLYIE